MLPKPTPSQSRRPLQIRLQCLRLHLRKTAVVQLLSEIHLAVLHVVGVEQRHDIPADIATLTRRANLGLQLLHRTLGDDGRLSSSSQHGQHLGHLVDTDVIGAKLQDPL